ncbi:aminotransferase class I/II-fold pyridoxal phosphate-dependent enzyme [Candidatus Gottesmanbacteria bacterium]|nr:aminotransferase class I/II-fold pyridoxal phosphate-dependent enzyme [Candidatus Gottesmanbacteria bacterium]
MSSHVQKLTTRQRRALKFEYDLSTGHAKQYQNEIQEAIIKKIPELFVQTQILTQAEIQEKFAEKFFNLAGQKSYKKLKPPLYHFSCSMSIEVVVNYLRTKNKQVGLIHPTFDNIGDILKRHNINLFPIEEEFLTNIDKLALTLPSTVDTLFLVCPNNPTGQELTREQFAKIVELCQKRHLLLILDFSFRFLSDFKVWDQYELLLKSGIEFVAIEDTGKTWPTMELKIGILAAPEPIYTSLEVITDDMLLNVSPVIFLLLTKYIEAENKEALSIENVVNNNREILRTALQSTPLTVFNERSRVSVEWVKLPEGWQSSHLSWWMEERGIHLLPGSPFFWNDYQKGEGYIRFALARPPSLFQKAISELQRLINEYQPLTNNNE